MVATHGSKHTNIPEAPWWIVDADDKRRARLNCISHLLSSIPYQDTKGKIVEMPKRKTLVKTDKLAIPQENFVPELY